MASKNLAELGRALWSSIEAHPVKSLNGGTTTLSYCPHSAPELLDEIDAQILTGFDLPLSFGLELAAFVRDLTAAGRDSQSQHGLRRALASSRELATDGTGLRRHQGEEHRHEGRVA